MHGPYGWVVSLSSPCAHLGFSSQNSALVMLPPSGHAKSVERNASSQNEAVNKVTSTSERRNILGGKAHKHLNGE